MTQSRNEPDVGYCWRIPVEGTGSCSSCTSDREIVFEIWETSSLT